MESRHSTHGYPQFDLEAGPRTMLRYDASPKEAREYYIERTRAEMKHGLENAIGFFVSLDTELERMKEGKTTSETSAVIENAMGMYRQMVTEIETIRKLTDERIKKIETLSDIEIMKKKSVRDVENESAIQIREAFRRFNALKKAILTILQGKY